MNATATALARHERARLSIFAAREDLSVVGKFCLALAVANLTGLAALVRIPLPFTPVPITGQVFAVLMAGILCGRNWGALSQLLYVAIGAAGYPWFQGGGAGVGHLASATGGYLVGFVAAAWFVGYMVDRSALNRDVLPLTAVMLGGVAIVLTAGMLWLTVLFGGDMGRAFMLGVLPFIPGGIAKAMAAAAFASVLLPRSPYGPETGRGPA